MRWGLPKKDNILEEIRYLHEKSPDKFNYFLEVETFNVRIKWVRELSEKLKVFNDTLSQPLTFGTNIRIYRGADFDEFFSLCAIANIRNFTVGLESGSERIRKNIMKRDYGNEDVMRMAGQARKHGHQFGFQNMIGLPTETEKEFMERKCPLMVVRKYPNGKVEKIAVSDMIYDI